MTQQETFEEYEVVIDHSGDLSENEYERLKQTALWCTLRDLQGMSELPSE